MCAFETKIKRKETKKKTWEFGTKDTKELGANFVPADRSRCPPGRTRMMIPGVSAKCQIPKGGHVFLIEQQVARIRSGRSIVVVSSGSCFDIFHKSIPHSQVSRGHPAPSRSIFHGIVARRGSWTLPENSSRNLSFSLSFFLLSLSLSLSSIHTDVHFHAVSFSLSLSPGSRSRCS